MDSPSLWMEACTRRLEIGLQFLQTRCGQTYPGLVAVDRIVQFTGLSTDTLGSRGCLIDIGVGKMVTDRYVLGRALTQRAGQ